MLTSVVLGIFVLNSAACTTTVAGKDMYDHPTKTFQAYGKQWKFVHTTRYDKRFWFFGITAGGDSQPNELFCLYKEDGTRIELHNQLYALQRDGSIKKIDCCLNYPGLTPPIANIDNKLIFFYQADLNSVTDCSIGTISMESNSQKNYSNTSRIVTFLGEFNPKTNQVILDNFFPGVDNIAPESVDTMKKYFQIMYEYRQPFKCTKKVIKGSP